MAPKFFITLVTEFVVQRLPWRTSLLFQLDEESVECIQDSWNRKILSLSIENNVGIHKMFCERITVLQTGKGLIMKRIRTFLVYLVQLSYNKTRCFEKSSLLLKIHKYNTQTLQLFQSLIKMVSMYKRN